MYNIAAHDHSKFMFPFICSCCSLNEDMSFLYFHPSTYVVILQDQTQMLWTSWQTHFTHN